MTDHTPEPWADYGNTLPKTLNAIDYFRARKCVNALSGIDDVDEFMEFLRQNLIFALEVKEYHEEESVAGGLNACQGYVRDALALFPQSKEPIDE